MPRSSAGSAAGNRPPLGALSKAWKKKQHPGIQLFALLFYPSTMHLALSVLTYHYSLRSRYTPFFVPVVWIKKGLCIA